MTVRLDSGGHGALFDISGIVSNNATWDELIYFYENGAGLVLTGLSFELQFRADSTDRSARATLSTSASQLVITNDSGGIPTILRINVPYTTISGLEGDYISDLVSKDADSKLIHWGHGVVTFRQAPTAF